MLQRGFSVINSHPWLMVVPGAAIAIAVFAFNAFGDALRDSLGLGTTPAQSGMKRGKLGITSVAEVTAPSAVDTDGEALALAPPDANPPMLAVHGLEVEFATSHGRVTVVEDVSFEVGRGEVVGLVGESGCGKSVTSTSIMRLLPTPPARIVKGSVRLDGREVLDLSVKDIRATRGSEIAKEIQDPMSSLNPAFTVGNQLIEAVRLHHKVSKATAGARALELLELVGIPDPQSRIDEYPHRLSGGMRQRVIIAMALANEPKLLIADEPTTALDVTVQAQILELLAQLRSELGMSMLFVTHDLGVVAEMCDRVVVMYAGQVVEEAPVEVIFSEAAHPYTRALLSSIPQSSEQLDRLVSIPGRVPVPGAWPTGCRFAPRCPFVIDECSQPVPLEQFAPGHQARCIRSDVVAASATTGAGA
jgi:oligopeptide/dipeptide ABC transporter ATP-binding protein